MLGIATWPGYPANGTEPQKRLGASEAALTSLDTHLSNLEARLDATEDDAVALRGAVRVLAILSLGLGMAALAMAIWALV